MVAAYTGKQTNPANRHARMYPSYRQQLTPTAYLVLGTLREYIFDEESRSVDYSWLVDATGLSYATVSRAMQELADQGFICRERESSGRGSHYRVTMLPPPEKRSPIPFFGSETNQERSCIDPPVDHSAAAESAAPTPQTTDFVPPIMLSNHQKQQKQHARDGHSSSESDQPDWQPHQCDLLAALQQQNAGAVAEQIVQARPDLTAADLHLDLAAAEARPSVHSPIGLVCAAWLAGSRVTAPRSTTEIEPSPPEPHIPEPPTDTEQFLLDQGFSTRAAQEFRQFDLAAVQAACDQAFSPLDTSYDRNQRIGKLVVRWRRQPPTELPEPEEAGVPPAGEESPLLVPDLDEARDEDENNPNLGVQVDTNDPESIWRHVQGSLQMMISRPDYTTYLHDTRLLALEGNQATIGCANSYQKAQIEDRYMGTIRQVLRDLLGHALHVRVLLW